VALLPELLRAWANEDLRDRLGREGSKGYQAENQTTRRSASRRYDARRPSTVGAQELVEAPTEPPPKLPPDKRTVSCPVALDFGAIFQLATGTVE